MIVDLKSALSRTVTVINRVDAKDNGTGKDIYRATVVDGAQFNAEIDSSASGTTLAISKVYKVKLPEAGYLPYKDFLTSEAGFTGRVGDWVVNGRVSETITPENLRSVLKGYTEVCEIKAVTEKLDSGMQSAVPWLEYVYCEGV